MNRMLLSRRIMVNKEELINLLVVNDIEITIRNNGTYGIYYDLNTGMKSHAYVVFEPEKILIYTRGSDEPEVISLMHSLDEVVDALCEIIKDCMWGRNSGNEVWMEFLVKKGVLEKEVKTHTTIKYT